MKNFLKYKNVLSTLLFLAILFFPVVAIGAPSDSSVGGSYDSSAGGSRNAGSYSIQNPLGTSTFPELLTKLLDAAIAIGIPVAVLFIVWAGFRFILARGKPGELEKARTNFLWTIVGIGIFLGASIIAKILEGTVNALKIP